MTKTTPKPSTVANRLMAEINKLIRPCQASQQCRAKNAEEMERLRTHWVVGDEGLVQDEPRLGPLYHLLQL
jgi:hypothetical protein